MKTFFRYSIIVCLLAGSGMASGQRIPDVLLLDSVYGYNWVSNSWSLNIKNYSIKNGSGQTIQSLYKKYNSGSGQFLDYVRFLYEFPGSSPDPSAITNQFWNSTTWSTYQYTHYRVKEIIDTTYTKNWDVQHHGFNSGLKNTYQFNDSLLPVENITLAWDTTTMNWINSSKTMYTYLNMVQPLEQILLSWQNSTSTWHNEYKSDDVYDGNNLLIGHYEYIWNDTASAWNSTVRVIYYNNFASLPYLAVKEVWNSSLDEWDSLEQSNYIYNQFNWLMTVLKQVYLQNSGTWVNSTLTFSTYSPGEIQQSVTGNIWDSIHLTWIPDTYQLLDSASQKLAETYTKYVDLQTFLIVSGTRDLYTYTPAGDTTSKLHQVWDVSGNSWTNFSQVVYTYDSHNLLTEDLTQTWVNASSTWVNAKKSDYYYSDFIGIGEHPAKEKPCFYANPMTTGNRINCPYLDPSKEYQFDLFTIQGAVVYTEIVNNGNSFIIKPSLAAGNYILRISEKGKTVYSDKVVVVN
jgi:hypothetical protein